MRLKIVGKEQVDYNKKSGEHVTGVRLYYTCEPSKNGIDGLVAGAEYFSSRYAAYNQAVLLSVGDEVDAYYNQYGNLDTLVPVVSSPTASAAAAVAAADKK